MVRLYGVISQLRHWSTPQPETDRLTILNITPYSVGLSPTFLLRIQFYFVFLRGTCSHGSFTDAERYICIHVKIYMYQSKLTHCFNQFNVTAALMLACYCLISLLADSLSLMRL